MTIECADYRRDTDATVDEGIAALARILGTLTRSQLKMYRAALLRESARRRVRVAISGGSEPVVREALEEKFSGRELEVSRDDALGGGVLISSGDDIIDMSIRGCIQKTIDGLKKA